MAGDGLDLIETICFCGDLFVLLSDQGPKLPALQSIAMAQMEEGENIVIGHYILFTGLSKNRKQDKKYFIPKEAILQMAIDRKKRGIVLIRVRGALLEIQGEQSEPISGSFLLCRTA